jgi:hypothetical protein
MIYGNQYVFIIRVKKVAVYFKSRYSSIQLK